MLVQTFPLRVAESQIHGMGCYATAPIPSEQRIIEYIGELIDYDEAVRRTDKNDKNHSEYILEVQDNIFIDAARAGNEARFINHSCDNNCYIESDGNRAYIVSLRDIAVGEELTFDYLFADEYREPCYCGAQTCRGFM